MLRLRRWTIAANVPGQGWVRHPRNRWFFTSSGALIGAAQATVASHWRVDWMVVHADARFLATTGFSGAASLRPDRMPPYSGRSMRLGSRPMNPYDNA